MNGMNQPFKETKLDNECSGPRPPVPGEESGTKKMIEGTDVLRNSPPSYLNWARTINHLLEDRDGVELFKKYVEEEAPTYNDHLNFYFACEGLKQQTDPEKVKQIIGAIYRFLRKSQLTISEDLRRLIKAGLKNETPLSPNIFDMMQQQVETVMREILYPAFLCSEIYILYIQRMSVLFEKLASGSGSGSSSGASCGSNASEVNALCGAYAITPQTSAAKHVPSSSITTSVSLNISNSRGVSCSASGSVYGPSTSASSSGSVSATETLPRSSTLPTLHEDSELSFCEESEKLNIDCDRGSSDMPIRLTRDLLLATQKRRLEIRPPGAHGYLITTNTNTSYVPNSRVDSERASISSGGRTDSDTMSLSNCSVDGRPYIQRRHSSTESKAIRLSAMANKETNTFQVIPRTQRLHSNEHRPLKETELLALLIPKLEEVKRKQELEERTRFERQTDDSSISNERKSNERAFAEAIREKFSLDEDNDQDILDQHVSRVWKDQTPHRSPGTVSPYPPVPFRRRAIPHEISFSTECHSNVSTMKHSKSMPDHNTSSRRLTNKWPSMNTDSGISLVSVDNLMKYRDPSVSTTTKLEEAKRRLEDESRRSRRFSHHVSSVQQSPISLPGSGHSSLHYIAVSNTATLPTKHPESTTVVFSFCDEEYPYRTKIPCAQPTLKQFKDYLPKKGNFRFFFKTQCDDPDSPVIQEEIVNDTDILPFFEGKIMGLVKPSE